MRLYFHKKIVVLILFSNALSMAKVPLSLFTKATKSGTVKRLLNVTPATSPSLSRVIANPALQAQKTNYAPSRNVWTTSTQNNPNQRNRLALLLDKARPRKGYLNAFGKVAALGTVGATANAIGVYTDIIDYEKHPIACLSAVCTIMPFIYAIESTKKYKWRAPIIFPSDFTRSNIDRCNANGRMREGFISFAAKNIAATDNEMIETIGYLLKRYPEARTRLMDEALSHLNEVHPSIFKNLISYSSEKEFLLRAEIFYDAQIGYRDKQEEFRDAIKELLQYNLSLKELIYLHYNYRKDRFYAVKEHSLSNPLPSTFPLWLYDNYDSSLSRRIKHRLYRDLSSLPTSYYSYIYDHILDYDCEKKEFREELYLSLKDGLLPIHQTNVLYAAMQDYDQNSAPFLIHCSQDNHQATQSEKHFCANVSSVMRYMFKEHTIKQTTNAIPMFKRALVKEREELSKGNHVFYHGRKWEYDFWADMDKHTYNLAHSNRPLIDIRLRFDDKQEGALCLNYALFANATNRSSNTASYVVNNHDFSSASSQFILDQPFKRFGLAKYFNRYKQEFEKLKTLHASCNKHGSLLMLSIPDKHVDIVYPAEEGSMGWQRKKIRFKDKYTADIRIILTALKTNTENIQWGNSDHIEFALRITPDLKDKVRIYPMSQADPAKYKEYTDYRDQLFAKIKTDMQRG